MNDSSQTDRQPEHGGARPVHPDGEIDAPLDEQAAHDAAGKDDTTQEAESPREGTGASSGGGSAVRDSPTQGLGPSSTGSGSPVRDADSPSEGTGPSATGTGSPVRDAASPAHGTGASAVPQHEEGRETDRRD